MVQPNQEMRSAHSPSLIEQVDIYELDIPFEDRGTGYGAAEGRWASLSMVLVRITTADGVSGWGECFAYGCRGSVALAVQKMVAPRILGQDAEDIALLMARVQHGLHLFGRYGIAMFAISGVDTALWDRKARARGVSLSELLGQQLRAQVRSYASLAPYGNREAVEGEASRAVAEGFSSVKLHESNPEIIQAARDAVGPEIELILDPNCAWSLEEAIAVLPDLEAAGIGLLEEPIFPPEDFEALAKLASVSSIPLTAGENACTRFELRKLMNSGAVRHPQPSVAKIGGVTEFIAAIGEADDRGIRCMPHSPYFGPGYWATLQLLAVTPGTPAHEYLYVAPQAFAGVSTPVPTDGTITIPDRPGTGFEPAWEVFEKYQVISPVQLMYTPRDS